MLEIRHQNMSTTQATKYAYEEIYATDGILHRESFYLWILSLIKKDQGKTLLDISCGQGKLVSLAQLMGFRAFGIDFSYEGVKAGKLESPKSHWIVGDGEKLPFPDHSFDYITHIGSLEHFVHPQLGANEIARLLKPNGKAVILLPNSFGFFGNIKYVAKHGDIFDDGQPLQRYGTRLSWIKILTNSQLKIQNTLGYDEIPMPHTKSDWIWLMKHPFKIVRKLLNLMIPLNLANHFVFIVTNG